jgi:hypothetical protein
MRIDYPELEHLHAQARRERAQAVYRYIVQPVIRFFSHAPRAHVAARPAKSVTA